jgi:intein/homing endonuclease
MDKITYKDFIYHLENIEPNKVKSYITIKEGDELLIYVIIPITESISYKRRYHFKDEILYKRVDMFGNEKDKDIFLYDGIGEDKWLKWVLLT